MKNVIFDFESYYDSTINVVDQGVANYVRALTSLAKQDGSGVKFYGTDGRGFKIKKQT